MKIRILIFISLFIGFNVVKSQEHHVHSIISQYHETNVVLSPDGNTLYFTLANHPLNHGGKQDKGDIWYAVRNQDGTWQAPLRLAGAVNDYDVNRVLGFSPDGVQMYLHGTYDGKKTPGIAISRWNGRLWSTPKKVSIPYFDNKSNEQSGFLTADNEILLLSIESFTTLGNEDIYVSFKDGNGFTEPKNLGSIINTKFQEFTPSLTNNGKVLFWSTNGKGGKGSLDVFFSERLDDSWTNWSEPQNIGDWINGQGRDYNFITIDHFDKVLLVTMNSSDEYGDIKIIEPLPEMDSLFTKPEIVLEDEVFVEDETIPALKGVIRDQAGQRLSSIEVRIEGPGYEDFAFTDREGVYQFEFEGQGNYSVDVSPESYIPQSKQVNISGGDATQELDFILMPVEVGVSVNLENVLFVRGTDNFAKGTSKALDLVVQFMKENPRVEIELGGHTDNTGNARLNLKLSKKRVKAVKNYLISQGIDRSRVSGKGYGGEIPIASNDQEETRRLNRRVEFTIVKN